MTSVLPEHIDVLKTLHGSGLISRHAMQTIRGQLFTMDRASAECYLRRLIRNCGKKARTA